MEHTQENLERRDKAGTGWLATVSALSVANALLALTPLSFSFPVGLGWASFAAAFFAWGVKNNDPIGQAVGVVFLAICAGIVVAFWRSNSADTRRLSPYIFGLSVYVLDTVLEIRFDNWPGIAFHAWVLYSLWAGFSARRKLIERARDIGLCGGVVETPVIRLQEIVEGGGRR